VSRIHPRTKGTAPDQYHPNTDLAARPGRHRISQCRTYPYAAAVLARSTEPAVLWHSRDQAGQRPGRSYRQHGARSLRRPSSLSVIAVVGATPAHGWLTHLGGRLRMPVHSWEPVGS